MFEDLKGKRILVVDDNEEICEIIKTYADIVQANLSAITDPLLVIEQLDKVKYDIIVLDVSMPQKNGFDLFKDIKTKFDIPILFLSAKAYKDDKIYGLNLGAEDYVTKPFILEELFLKIQMIVNRKSNFYYEAEDFKFDILKNKLFYKKEELKLTQKSFLLLLYLVKNKNRVVLRKELMKEVWEYEEFLDDRTIDSHIKEIRKKINKNIVKTIRGKGYIYENN